MGCLFVIINDNFQIKNSLNNNYSYALEYNNDRHIEKKTISLLKHQILI